MEGSARQTKDGVQRGQGAAQQSAATPADLSDGLLEPTRRMRGKRKRSAGLGARLLARASLGLGQSDLRSDRGFSTYQLCVLVHLTSEHVFSPIK